MAFCLSYLAVLLQFSLFALTVGSPVEPRDAMITPAPLLEREVESKSSSWIGYYTQDNGISIDVLESYMPFGYILSTSNGYWAYCLTRNSDYTTKCLSNFFTTCTGGNILVGLTTITCSSACRYTHLFTTSVSDGSPLSSFGCGTDDPVGFYRVNPRTDQFFLDRTYFSTSTTRASSLPSGASTGGTPATPTPTPTASSSSSDPHKSSSKAWIAGVVIGPLALIVVIIVAVFYFLRRRKFAGPPLQIAPHPNLPPRFNTDELVSPLKPTTTRSDTNDERMSGITAGISTVGSNTWTLHSGGSNGTGKPGGVHADLPELVTPKKRI